MQSQFRGRWILVSGPPAVGKTTFAKRLSEELDVPRITRDDLKEAMFDSLGWKDRAWSIAVGHAATRVLSIVLKQLARPGVDLVIDGPFEPGVYADVFHQALDGSEVDVLEVSMHVTDGSLVGRFRSRSQDAARHPGHRDAGNFAEFEARLAIGSLEPLGVGHVFRFDCTDPQYSNSDAALRYVCSWYERSMKPVGSD